MTGAPVDRYFFVHMQKTAGTALFKRLFGCFGRDAVYPLVEDQGTVEASLDVDLLRRRLAEHGDRLRVITGHFPLCVVDLLGGGYRTFTVLRHPVERTLSFLRHSRKVDPALAGVPLEAIYEDRVLYEGLIRNHMVRMLSLRASELTAGAMTPIEHDGERLVAAKRNLAERIEVFGLQERFEEFCDDLAARFGIDLGPPQVANRTEPTEVPDSFRRRIAEDNALDMELYHWACRLYEERHR